MAKITLKGNPINTNGNLPKVGSKAMNFKLIKKDLTEFVLNEAIGKKIVLNIFPSLDTPVCATSVRKFNSIVNDFPNTMVLCISKDLPFAQARFCGAEGLNNVITLSEMRDSNFSEATGVRIVDGPMMGLMARAVIVINQEGIIEYVELVPEIIQEPNYNAVLEILKQER